MLSLVLVITLIFGQFTFAAETSNADGLKGITNSIVEETKELSQQMIVLAKQIFSDVKNHWAEGSIKDMVDRGVVAGFPDGTFRPDDRVNVDQFVKMLLMSLTEKLPDGRIQWANAYVDQLDYSLQHSLIDTLEYFDPNDIPITPYWADPYLDQADRMNIIERHDSKWGGKFDVPLTREKAAFIVQSTLAWMEFTENSNYGELALLSVTDGHTNITYTHSVATVILKGLMRGYPDQTFRLQGYITRAEAVLIVDRILNKSKRDPYKPDLSNYHHTSIELPSGTKYYVFDSKEFVDVLSAMEQAKNETSGYLLGEGGVAFTYYPDKQTYEDYEIQAKYYNAYTENPFVLSLGLDQSERSYVIIYNINSDIKDYQGIYDAGIQALFSDESTDFNKAFMDFAEGKRESTTPQQPIDSMINDRSVRIMSVDQSKIVAFISEKR